MSVQPVHAAKGAATSEIQARHAAIEKIIHQKLGAEAQQEAISKHLDGLLDYRSIAEKSLGKHWKAQNEQEQAKFVELLKVLVEKSYRKNIESTMSYKLNYLDETTKAKDILVSLNAQSKKNKRAPKINIQYVMRSQGTRFFVIDIVTDGVSMVRNYRRQFRRIIKKDGWTGLIERMKTKASK